MEIRMFKTKAEMEKAHEKDISDFPFVWAFSNDQFYEGAEKTWGMKTFGKANLSKILSIGAGGYILKSDREAMEEMFARHKAERKAFNKSFKNLQETIESEMWNHEYGYTGDSTDTLNALGDEIISHPRFVEAWKKAEAKVMREYNEINNSENEVCV